MHGQGTLYITELNEDVKSVKVKTLRYGNSVLSMPMNWRALWNGRCAYV